MGGTVGGTVGVLESTGPLITSRGDAEVGLRHSKLLNSFDLHVDKTFGFLLAEGRRALMKCGVECRFRDEGIGVATILGTTNWQKLLPLISGVKLMPLSA